MLRSVISIYTLLHVLIHKGYKQLGHTCFIMKRNPIELDINCHKSSKGKIIYQINLHFLYF